jgi:5-methylcytosine-specific restriction enzyme A
MPKRRSALWQDPNWRSWYQLEIWRKRRRRQLQHQPLCEMCLADGIVAPATIVDHVEPHHVRRWR